MVFPMSKSQCAYVYSLCFLHKHGLPEGGRVVWGLDPKPGCYRFIHPSSCELLERGDLT